MTSRRRLPEWLNGPTALTAVLVAILAAMVLMPLGFVIAAGLSSGALGHPESVFTTRHFAVVYTTTKYLEPLKNTLWLAFVVTIVSLSVGSLLGFLVARTDLPGRRFLPSLLSAPIFISPLLCTLGWIALASPRAGMFNVWINQLFGLKGSTFNIISFGGMVFVMSLFFIPYAFLFVVGTFRNLDATMEEAARMTGASPLRTFRSITLPLMGPALLSAGVMVFVLSAELFIVPMMLGSQFNFRTIPMIIYEAIDYGWTAIGEGAALGTLLFWITAGGIFVYQRLTRLSRRFVTVSGKGSRAREIELGPWKPFAVLFVALYLLLAVVLPVAMLVVGSFMKFLTARINTSLFTLRNYEQLFTTAQNALAIQNTLFLAVAGATLGVLLAAVISTVILRTQVRGRAALDYLAALPISIPSVVLALGMLAAYNYLPIPLYGTIWVLLLAYVTRFLGHGTRITSSAVLQIDPELGEAARVTGASPGKTFRLIMLPLIRPSLLSAWTLLFALMVIEVSSTLFLYTTNTVTMSVTMWNAIQMTGSLAAYPMAVLQCLIVFVVLGIIHRGRRPRLLAEG